MQHKLKDEIIRRFYYIDGRVLIRVSGQWRGKVGEEAGSPRKDGRRVIQVQRIRLFTHQIVWLLFNDTLPAGSIDHIDNDQTNNKIENLRAASRSQQQGNKALQANNTTGFKGVSFKKENKSKPWRAGIKTDGKSLHLGYYSTPEEAAKAYDVAATSKFGDYALLNFKEARSDF